MSWLVTGGAGYIGSHVVRAFAEQGIETVVIDDLSSGRHGFLPQGTPFVQGTILDGPALDENTMRSTPVASIAARRVAVPVTFCR